MPVFVPIGVRFVTSTTDSKTVYFYIELNDLRVIQLRLHVVSNLREAYSRHVQTYKLRLVDQLPILVRPCILGVAMQQDLVALFIRQSKALVLGRKWQALRRHVELLILVIATGTDEVH